MDAIDEEFGKLFGRRYGGQIEEYRMEEAEIALVCLGSHTGTARVVIDKKREEGIKVGLVKVRSFRPFPKEKLAEAVKGLKAVGVIDRSVCFTWQGGHIFRDLKTSLYGHDYIPLVNFIGGLAGHDITIPLIENAVDVTMNAAEGKSFNEVIWMALEDS
jgi:pyruvate ferredoxin oxidoreductase alpha subunit/phenylglyoxylate dehydrogenase alpha subunit